MKSLILIVLAACPWSLFSQSDIEKVMRGGELLLGGLSILKVARSGEGKKDAKTVESLCVKNKLSQKITFRISGKDDQDNEVNKELVIQQDGKECLLLFPKGIFTYEILLANNETYKKGEYRIEDEVTFVLKDP